MTKHKTGTREEWLAARLDLLKAEKELTRRSDELAKRRQELPWVRIEKQYQFDTDDGKASLADLFGRRSQLLIYHYMFGPDYTAGCMTCSTIADAFNRFVVHLANHDVTLMCVSRAPLAKLQAYKRRMGWTFPWASSFGNDFNYDFKISFTDEQQREGRIEYNYHRDPGLTAVSPLRGGLANAQRRRNDNSHGRNARGRQRGRNWNRCGHIHSRASGHERLGPGGRRRLPHLFRLCPRIGRAVGHVSVARPRSQGAQRVGRCLVATPRRV